MPTRPFRILSRNLDQRLGAEAAWKRAIEIIRKSARGQGASQVLMRALRSARDEHLAELRADLLRFRDLGNVELVRELDKKIESMTKQADIEIARRTRPRVSRSVGALRSDRALKSPGSSRTRK
jgi:hypothetical protein